MAEVFNSKYSSEEIEKILDTQALLAEVREKFPSDVLLENLGLWFKDTDEVNYADVILAAEIMDIGSYYANQCYNARVRFRIRNDYFLCQLGTRMQYASSFTGTRLPRLSVDIIIPISNTDASVLGTLSEKYYFEAGGGQLINLYFVPDDGETLNELTTIEIRYDKGLKMADSVCDTYIYKDGEQVYGAEAFSGDMILDASGNTIGYSMDILDLSTFEETTITEKGTYTLTIPQGAFLLGDEEIPNEETTLTYHIE